MEDPVVPLERNLCGHPLAGLLWERQFEKVLLKHGWEKIPNCECLFVHREKGLFLSVYVDDMNLAGKKHNIDPMWKVLNKEVNLGEPTSFLDHVHLGCTQQQCETSKDVVDNDRTMFESRISAGGQEKQPFPQNLRISSWSYDMEDHAEVCGTAETDFGHPYLTNFGQTDFGQTHFGQFQCSFLFFNPKGGTPKGGAPKGGALKGGKKPTLANPVLAILI